MREHARELHVSSASARSRCSPVVALLRLAESGWVEDVQPAAHVTHVLAHQVMALFLQEGGISRHKLLQWIEGE
jgi:hypothetical protein